MLCTPSNLVAALKSRPAVLDERTVRLNLVGPPGSAEGGDCRAGASPTPLLNQSDTPIEASSTARPVGLEAAGVPGHGRLLARRSTRAPADRLARRPPRRTSPRNIHHPRSRHTPATVASHRGPCASPPHQRRGRCRRGRSAPGDPALRPGWQLLWPRWRATCTSPSPAGCTTTRRRRFGRSGGSSRPRELDDRHRVDRGCVAAHRWRWGRFAASSGSRRSEFLAWPRSRREGPARVVTEADTPELGSPASRRRAARDGGSRRCRGEWPGCRSTDEDVDAPDAVAR